MVNEGRAHMLSFTIFGVKVSIFRGAGRTVSGIHRPIVVRFKRGTATLNLAAGLHNFGFGTAGSLGTWQAEDGRTCKLYQFRGGLVLAETTTTLRGARDMSDTTDTITISFRYALLRPLDRRRHGDHDLR